MADSQLKCKCPRTLIKILLVEEMRLSDDWLQITSAKQRCQHIGKLKVKASFLLACFNFLLSLIYYARG
jgi:hypothetical protein